LAQTEGRTEIIVDDVNEINSLFLDAKSSSKILQEQAHKYIGSVV